MLRQVARRAIRRSHAAFNAARHLSAAASNVPPPQNPKEVRTFRENPEPNTGMEQSPHPSLKRKIQPHHYSGHKDQWFPHPVYSEAEMDSVEVIHDEPKSVRPQAAEQK